jgi:CxxC motif-containing protein (DUF1111 family)
MYSRAWQNGFQWIAMIFAELIGTVEQDEKLLQSVADIRKKNRNGVSGRCNSIRRTLEAEAKGAGQYHWRFCSAAGEILQQLPHDLAD